jgi:hypothetical protein
MFLTDQFSIQVGKFRVSIEGPEPLAVRLVNAEGEGVLLDKDTFEGLLEEFFDHYHKAAVEQKPIVEEAPKVLEVALKITPDISAVVEKISEESLDASKE